MMAHLRRASRSTLAILHRINRSPRIVGAVALGIHLAFRWAPPILWDRLRWAQDLQRRAVRGCGRDDETVLRRIFNEPARVHLPWRLSDVLGFTERRRTPLGQVWHAEYQAARWPQTVRYLRKRYRITDDAEATDAV